MNGVSLFSGVGGFELAMQRAGIDVTATCEIDRAARAVLEYHFPNAHHFSDIKEVTARDLNQSRPHLFTAGFPCQDLSVAGKRAGLAGERSGLFFEIVRLLREVRPRYFVLENVPGLLSSKRGRDFGIVLGSLVELGYGVAYRILDAQNFGVAQRRRRVFIVGHIGNDWRTPSEILALGESVRGNTTPSSTKGAVVAALTANGVGTCGADDNQGQAGHLIAVPLTARHGRNNADDVPVLLTMREGKDGGGKGPLVSEDVSLTLATGNGQVLILLTSTSVRRLTPTECERLQGFPDGWTAVNNQKDSARYRQMGNAVCVPVAEWIIRRVAAVFAE